MKLIINKMKPIAVSIGFLLILMLMFSCGGASDQAYSEYAESAVDSSGVSFKVDEKVEDSVNTSPVHAVDPDIQKKSARLAYNYPPEMTRYKSEDINVYVSIVNPASFVKDTLMKILATQQSPSGKKTIDSIVTTNILLYKRLLVELMDPDSAFTIKRIYGEAWQEVDSTGDNRWRWSVTPLTDAPEAKLVIKVMAQKPVGTQVYIDDRTFFIKVKMVGIGQTIRSWITYMQDNKGMVVTVILIPLFAYFGKRYFDRKSKK
jgi:hypothetical protein